MSDHEKDMYVAEFYKDAGGWWGYMSLADRGADGNRVETGYWDKRHGAEVELRRLANLLGWEVDWGSDEGKEV